MLMLFRWLMTLFASFLMAAGAAAETRGGTVLVLGDSLSAEYGIERGSGWVSLLEPRIRDTFPGVQIKNASISGDTTSGGLTRLPDALLQHDPAVVLIELGANDALRGLSLQATRENLARMITLSRESGASVILVGMQIPPNYGTRYSRQFRELFPELAQEYGAALVPFLLEGMASDSSLFQADGIHPNEAAQPLIADNVWPVLQSALERLQ
ncbi:arylesterase [Paracandidimonas soli]|uniref:arylesterase n=1 Tax=Paracandidimonas soli TaxID=1917182 RepID=UPI003DA73817